MINWAKGKGNLDKRGRINSGKKNDEADEHVKYREKKNSQTMVIQFYTGWMSGEQQGEDKKRNEEMFDNLKLVRIKGGRSPSSGILYYVGKTKLWGTSYLRSTVVKDHLANRRWGQGR